MEILKECYINAWSATKLPSLAEIKEALESLPPPLPRPDPDICINCKAKTDGISLPVYSDDAFISSPVCYLCLNCYTAFKDYIKKNPEICRLSRNRE